MRNMEAFLLSQEVCNSTLENRHICMNNEFKIQSYFCQKLRLGIMYIDSEETCCSNGSWRMGHRQNRDGRAKQAVSITSKNALLESWYLLI